MGEDLLTAFSQPLNVTMNVTETLNGIIINLLLTYSSPALLFASVGEATN
jgi:hypothetical protein